MHEDKVYTPCFARDASKDQRAVPVKPADGAILEDVAWENYSVEGSSVEFGVMSHLKQQFGGANRLTLLASCLLLVTTMLFRLATWRTRRPVGRSQLHRYLTPSRIAPWCHWHAYLSCRFHLSVSMVVSAVIEWMLDRTIASA